MVSCDTCFLTLGLVSAFLVVSMDARSWDIAVAIREEIDYFAQNGTRVGVYRVTNATKLTGLAYDNDTRTIYTSDRKSQGVVMYSSNLTENESNTHTVFNKTSGTIIEAMVFDPVNRTLFWSDAGKNAIMKMHVPLSGDPSTPEILHDLKEHKPYGIAIDICNRFIYWSKCNEELTACSIERSRLEGGSTIVVVERDLSVVLGLAVDHYTGKLYWINDIDGDWYNIERSNLDGKERAIFMNGTRNQPLYIAIDKESVYWTDRENGAVQKKEKNKSILQKPEEFKSYIGGIHPTGIITRDNIGDLDCEAILKAQKNQPQTPATPKPKVQNVDDLPSIFKKISFTTPKPKVQYVDNPTTTVKKINSTPQPEKNCLNEGSYDPSTATCICKEGFTGDHCEVLSVCHNYCINGICTLDAEGLPKCDCGTSHNGTRCEIDVCDGYCLNNGVCSVSSAGPSCKCDNFKGSRCEYTTELDKLCSLYCTQIEQIPSSVGVAFCKCSELNGTRSEHLIATEPLVSSTVILSVLISLIGSLTIVVGVLSYHVHKLRRRPRIRKRFVVSKGGVTPLTSRPQLPPDSCEITIENCCNMNICETPCFEPKLRTTPTKSSSTKLEEKNSLLDSMEGADSC